MNEHDQTIHPETDGLSQEIQPYINFLTAQNAYQKEIAPYGDPRILDYEHSFMIATGNSRLIGLRFHADFQRARDCMSSNPSETEQIVAHVMSELVRLQNPKTALKVIQTFLPDLTSDVTITPFNVLEQLAQRKGDLSWFSFIRSGEFQPSDLLQLLQDYPISVVDDKITFVAHTSAGGSARIELNLDSVNNIMFAAVYDDRVDAELVWKYFIHLNNQKSAEDSRKVHPLLQVFSYKHPAMVLEYLTPKFSQVDGLTDDLGQILAPMLARIAFDAVNQNDIQLQEQLVGLIDSYLKSINQAESSLRETDTLTQIDETITKLTVAITAGSKQNQEYLLDRVRQQKNVLEIPSPENYSVSEPRQIVDEILQEQNISLERATELLANLKAIPESQWFFNPSANQFYELLTVAQMYLESLLVSIPQALHDAETFLRQILPKINTAEDTALTNAVNTLLETMDTKPLNERQTVRAARTVQYEVLKVKERTPGTKEHLLATKSHANYLHEIAVMLGLEDRQQALSELMDSQNSGFTHWYYFPGVYSALLGKTPLDSSSENKLHNLELPLSQYLSASQLDLYLHCLQTNTYDETLRSNALDYIKNATSDHYTSNEHAFFWKAHLVMEILKLDPSFVEVFKAAELPLYGQVRRDLVYVQIQTLNPDLAQEIAENRPEVLNPTQTDEQSFEQEVQKAEQIQSSSDFISRLDAAMHWMTTVTDQEIENEVRATPAWQSLQAGDKDDQSLFGTDQLSTNRLSWRVNNLYQEQIKNKFGSAFLEFAELIRNGASEDEICIGLDHMCGIILPKFAQLFQPPYNVNGPQVRRMQHGLHGFKNQISQVFHALPSQLKIRYIPQFAAVYNEEFLSIRDESEYVDWSECLAGLSVDESLDMIYRIGREYNKSRRFAHVGSNQLDRRLYSAVDRLVVANYEDAANIYDYLGRHFDKCDFTIIKKFLIAYGNFRETDAILTFQEEVNAVAQRIGMEYGSALLLAYLSPQLASRKISEIEDLQLQLQKHNNDPQVLEGKKLQDINSFYQEHQESLAKLFLFFPQTTHSSALILETVRQHGFSRLVERLRLLEPISVEDVQFINQTLSSLPNDQVSQGLILSIVSIVSAFYDPVIQNKEAWKELLQQHNFSSASELRKQLGSLFLIEVAQSMSIDPTIVKNTDLSKWNMRHIPRLVEALPKLRSDPAFEQLFNVVVKSSFYGNFSEVIDPEAIFDESIFTNDELTLITEIRRHNADTLQRFAERGLDHEAFKQGETIDLRGRVTAVEIIESSYDEYKITVEKELDIISRLGLPGPGIQQKIDELRAAFTVLRSGSDTGPGISSLVDFIKQSANQPREKSSKPRIELTVEEKERLVSLILPHLIEKIHRDGQGSIEKFKEVVPKKTKKALSKVFTTTKEGNDIVFAKKLSDPTVLVQVLSENTKFFNQLIGNETMTSIWQILPQETPSETHAPTPQRPNLEAQFIQLKSMLDELVQLLRTELPQTQQYGIAESDLELSIDHLTGYANELTQLHYSIKNAQDQDYDVTIRRWQRQPTDIFFGNDLQCCVAIENFNGFGMLQFLVGYDFELDEIVDNITGERVGGTFDFIQERIDSTLERPVLAYGIDNAELNPSHQFLRWLARHHKQESAARVFDRMITGKNVVNNGVRLGTSYNDIPTNGLRVVEERMRKVGGPNMGMGAYTDTAVQARRIGATHRHPSAFLNVPLYVMSDQDPSPMVERQAPKGAVHTLQLINDEERTAFIEQHLSSALDMERSLFGIWAQVEELEKIFHDGDNAPTNLIVVYALDDQDRLIGLSYGFDSGRDDQTFYVQSSAVDWNHQNTGIGKRLRTQIEEEAGMLGYQFLSRHAMADTGYAQRLLREYLEHETRTGDKILVEPNITAEQLEEYLNNPNSFSYGLGLRSQVYIVSKLQNT